MLAAVSRSERNRIADAVGERSANRNNLSSSSTRTQLKRSSPETPADVALSGSGRAAPHLGSAQLHGRGSRKAFRAQAGLWLSLHRSLFVASGPCGWSRKLDGCPGAVGNRS